MIITTLMPHITANLVELKIVFHAQAQAIVQDVQTFYYMILLNHQLIVVLTAVELEDIQIIKETVKIAVAIAINATMLKSVKNACNQTILRMEYVNFLAEMDGIQMHKEIARDV